MQGLIPSLTMNFGGWYTKCDYWSTNSVSHLTAPGNTCTGLRCAALTIALMLGHIHTCISVAHAVKYVRTYVDCMCTGYWKHGQTPSIT